MKLRYIEKYSKYIMLRTMFCLAMDINFVLDYNILIEIAMYLLVWTRFIFSQINQNWFFIIKNLPVSMEEQSQLKTQALHALKLSMLFCESAWNNRYQGDFLIKYLFHCDIIYNSLFSLLFLVYLFSFFLYYLFFSYLFTSFFFCNFLS